MQYAYSPSYYRLYPPSSLLRETNKIATCFCMYLIVLGFFWSYDISRLHLHREITDLLLVGSTLLILWYLILSIISFKRLNRYRHEYKLSRIIHHLLIPWAALLIVTSTIMTFALIDRTTGSSTPGFLYSHLYKILASELVVLAAFEVPGLKKWLPQISPLRFKAIFMKSLPVLLGRERRTETEEHAQEVFEFKSEFESYLRDVDLIDKSGSEELIDRVEVVSTLGEARAAEDSESIGQ